MCESEADLCQLCWESGRKSRLRSYQINLEEAFQLCEDPACTYPVGTEEASSFVVKRDYLELVLPAKPVLQTPSNASTPQNPVRQGLPSLPQTTPAGKVAHFLAMQTDTPSMQSSPIYPAKLPFTSFPRVSLSRQSGLLEKKSVSTLHQNGLDNLKSRTRVDHLETSALTGSNVPLPSKQGTVSKSHNDQNFPTSGSSIGWNLETKSSGVHAVDKKQKDGKNLPNVEFPVLPKKAELKKSRKEENKSTEDKKTGDGSLDPGKDDAAKNAEINAIILRKALGVQTKPAPMSLQNTLLVKSALVAQNAHARSFSITNGFDSNVTSDFGNMSTNGMSESVHCVPTSLSFNPCANSNLIDQKQGGRNKGNFAPFLLGKVFNGSRPSTPAFANQLHVSKGQSNLKENIPSSVVSSSNTKSGSETTATLNVLGASVKTDSSDKNNRNLRVDGILDMESKRKARKNAKKRKSTFPEDDIIEKVPSTVLTEKKFEMFPNAKEKGKIEEVPCYVQWRNKDALCWLDVVLCLVVHNRSLKELVAKNTCRTESLVSELLKAYQRAQIVEEQRLRLKALQPQKSIQESNLVKENGSGISQFSPKKTKTCTLTIVYPEGKVKDIKTGAGHEGPLKEADFVRKLESSSLSSGDSEAEKILDSAREVVFTKLCPKLKCEKGRNDSPVFTFPVLLGDNDVIKNHFQLQYKFRFMCTCCGHREEDQCEKILPTFPGTMQDFSMAFPSHYKTCVRCGTVNQKRTMIFTRVPETVLLHFVEGLPHNDFAKLDFVSEGCRYTVTGVIQYTNKPDHFIAWLRNPKGELWMECDDLKSQVCEYKPQVPNIPPREIHIVMWEKTREEPPTEPPSIPEQSVSVSKSWSNLYSKWKNLKNPKTQLSRLVSMESREDTVSTASQQSDLSEVLDLPEFVAETPMQPSLVRPVPCQAKELGSIPKEALETTKIELNSQPEFNKVKGVSEKKTAFTSKPSQVNSLSGPYTVIKPSSVFCVPNASNSMKQPSCIASHTRCSDTSTLNLADESDSTNCGVKVDGKVSAEVEISTAGTVKPTAGFTTRSVVLGSSENATCSPEDRKISLNSTCKKVPEVQPHKGIRSVTGSSTEKKEIIGNECASEQITASEIRLISSANNVNSYSTITNLNSTMFTGVSLCTAVSVGSVFPACQPVPVMPSPGQISVIPSSCQVPVIPSTHMQFTSIPLAIPPIQTFQTSSKEVDSLLNQPAMEYKNIPVKPLGSSVRSSLELLRSSKRKEKTKSLAKDNGGLLQAFPSYELPIEKGENTKSKVKLVPDTNIKPTTIQKKEVGSTSEILEERTKSVSTCSSPAGSSNSNGSLSSSGSNSFFSSAKTVSTFPMVKAGRRDGKQKFEGFKLGPRKSFVDGGSCSVSSRCSPVTSVTCGGNSSVDKVQFSSARSSPVTMATGASDSRDPSPAFSLVSDSGLRRKRRILSDPTYSLLKKMKQEKTNRLDCPTGNSVDSAKRNDLDCATGNKLDGPTGNDMHVDCATGSKLHSAVGGLKIGDDNQTKGEKFEPHVDDSRKISSKQTKYKRELYSNNAFVLPGKTETESTEISDAKRASNTSPVHNERICEVTGNTVPLREVENSGVRKNISDKCIKTIDKPRSQKDVDNNNHSKMNSISHSVENSSVSGGNDVLGKKSEVRIVYVHAPDGTQLKYVIENGRARIMREGGEDDSDTGLDKSNNVDNLNGVNRSSAQNALTKSSFDKKSNDVEESNIGLNKNSDVTKPVAVSGIMKDDSRARSIVEKVVEDIKAGKVDILQTLPKKRKSILGTCTKRNGVDIKNGVDTKSDVCKRSRAKSTGCQSVLTEINTVRKTVPVNMVKNKYNTTEASKSADLKSPATGISSACSASTHAENKGTVASKVQSKEKGPGIAKVLPSSKKTRQRVSKSDNIYAKKGKTRKRSKFDVKHVKSCIKNGGITKVKDMVAGLDPEASEFLKTVDSVNILQKVLEEISKEKMDNLVVSEKVMKDVKELLDEVVIDVHLDAECGEEVEEEDDELDTVIEVFGAHTGNPTVKVHNAAIQQVVDSNFTITHGSMKSDCSSAALNQSCKASETDDAIQKKIGLSGGDAEPLSNTSAGEQTSNFEKESDINETGECGILRDLYQALNIPISSGVKISTGSMDDLSDILGGVGTTVSTSVSAGSKDNVAIGVLGTGHFGTEILQNGHCQ